MNNETCSLEDHNLHLVRGLAYLSDLESYSDGSLAPGRVTHMHARQVKG